MSEEKQGAYHPKNVALAQIMATMAQASEEKDVSVVEKDALFDTKGF